MGARIRHRGTSSEMETRSPRWRSSLKQSGCQALGSGTMLGSPSSRLSLRARSFAAPLGIEAKLEPLFLHLSWRATHCEDVKTSGALLQPRG
eukprot:scaffold122976_cov28-Tisochrysis_lutea.AAC.2